MTVAVGIACLAAGVMLLSGGHVDLGLATCVVGAIIFLVMFS